MDASLITEVETFRGLRDEWNELLARSSSHHAFLRHEWLLTWWEHFGSPDALRIICVRESGRLVGIAPLMDERLRVRGVFSLRCLQFLGGPHADYRDFILDHDQRWRSLEAILTHCVSDLRDWQFIGARGVRGDSATNYLLPTIAARLTLHHESHASGICPYIPLQGGGPDTWERYRERRAAKGYRRKLQKLSREQAVEVCFRDGEAAVGAMPELFRLHHQAWQERGGSRALPSRALEEFHLALARSLSPTEVLRVALLRVNGEPIAARYYYAHTPLALAYLTGFDPTYEQYSPGALLQLAVVENLREAGYEEFDLLRGDEAYKLNFTQVARARMDHTLARTPRTLRVTQVLEALSGPS